VAADGEGCADVGAADGDADVGAIDGVIEGATVALAEGVAEGSPAAVPDPSEQAPTERRVRRRKGTVP
jgi:hypothetical protein